MTRGWRAAVSLGVLLGAVHPAPLAAQQWTAGVSAGQTVFEPVSSKVGTNQLAASLRYDSTRDAWVFGAIGAPLRGDDPFWTTLGSGARLAIAASRGGGISFGADVGAHAYLFRDATVDRIGTGGTIEAMPVVRLSKGATAVDVRGGWRGHALTYAGLTDRRGVVEAGARVTRGRALRLSGDARVVRAPEGSFPFAGAALTYAGSAFQAWAQAGRWMAETLDDVSWSAGGGYAVNRRLHVWTTVRQDGRDPLYWNTSRRSWSVGLTTTFGGGAPATVTDEGLVTVRVPVADAPGTGLWIAGSFNDWQPVPMVREGRAWVLRLPLVAGVYRYAFRSSDGTWFVPPSIEGRRDDGMGGHVAVLVVER